MTPVPDSAPCPGMPRLRVIVICFLVAVLDGFDAQALAYVAPLLIDEWRVAAGSFAPAFAAGLAGLAVGAVLFGTAADRVGRRPAIVGALALCGIGSLATAFAPSFAALLPLRFVTGLGIGGSLPNVIALTAEWMPHRYRAVAIGTMICGFPLGGFLGGVLAAQLTPAHGWQAVFVLGGAAPLLLAVTASLWLPESVRFLAWRHAARPRAAGAVTADLFRDGRVAATCLLWLAFFMNLLAIFLMVSWLPVLLRDAGVLLEGAMLTAALYSLGGIPGSILVTALMGRFGAGRVLGTTLLAGALATVLLGSVMVGGVVLQATILIAGRLHQWCPGRAERARRHHLPDAVAGNRHGLGPGCRSYRRHPRAACRRRADRRRLRATARARPGCVAGPGRGRGVGPGRPSPSRRKLKAAFVRGPIGSEHEVGGAQEHLVVEKDLQLGSGVRNRHCPESPCPRRW